MATNGIANMLNSRLRMSGLSSGIDTESMIQQLMQVERMKVDKVIQARKLLEWKRDDYREITSKLKSLHDEFLDAAKPLQNLRSSTSFGAFGTSFNTTGGDSFVSITTGAGATAGTHKITVDSLASAAKIEGSSLILDPVQGTNTVSRFDLKNKQISVTLDGQTKTINLADYGTAAGMEAGLESALNSAFGAGRFNLTFTGDDISGYRMEFGVTTGSSFTIAETTNGYISSLGFGNGQTNYATAANSVNTSDWTAYNGGTFKINYGGTDYTIDLNSTPASAADLASTIQGRIDTIVGSDKLKVTEDAGKLTFTSVEGKAFTLSAGTTSNVLDKMGFSSGAGARAMSSSEIDISGDEDGKSITINVNGIDTVIEFDTNFSDLDSMAAYIQSKLTGVNVTKDSTSNKLIFSDANPGDGDVKKITFKKGSENALELMGFTASDNKSNKIQMNTGIASLKDYFTTNLNVPTPDSNVILTINGTEIDVGKKYADATIADIMSAINTSDAGVKLTYDSLNNKFTMTSKTEGTASTITYTDTDPTNGVLKALGIAGQPVTAGTDAVFDLDGVNNMVRSSNTFTIDGVTYTLKAKSTAATPEVSFEVKADVDAVFNKIKGFVEKYNDVLGKLNSEISEERNRDYAPLTDEQKEVMKENDIELWENKARSGMLRGDSLLYSIVTKMRKALSEPIDGVSTSLSSIGITTGTYEKKGQLVIDETKLKKALTENPDSVIQLFTKNDSGYSYTEAMDDADKRKARFDKSGLAHRLYDIIQDNIRTTRNQDGKKGLLLEKAGITGDLSEFQNTLVREMTDKDEQIKELNIKLARKENAYYAKFTAMEQALSKMNSQSSWLSSQLGGG